MSNENEIDTGEILQVLRNGIIKSRRIHPIWHEMKIMKQRFPKLPSSFGKWQYWYRSKTGKLVDCIELSYTEEIYGFIQWEICSPTHFFDGPERYRSLQEAEKRIIELLTDS